MISIINNNQFEYYPEEYVLSQKPFSSNANNLCIYNGYMSSCYNTGWITESIQLDNFVFKIDIRARLTLSDTTVILTYANRTQQYNINLNGNLIDYFQFKKELYEHVNGEIKVNIPNMSELSYIEYKVYYK